jgi:hypothetical protein
MKAKGLAIIAAIALLAALLLVDAGPGAASPAMTVLTFHPTLTFNPSLSVVSIPDAALNQALHTKTGIAPANPLHTYDLAAITGTLDVGGKGIVNGDGLQYCTNLTNLFLTDNLLTALPTGFENLTKLKVIILERNKFTDFPAALLLMPGLKEIRFANNSLAALPSNIDAITNLEMVDVSHNKVAALPVNLWKLSKLESFYASYNELKKVPKELFKAPALKTLVLINNKITELPVEVKSAPKLTTLDLRYNMLAKLPAGIGSAPQLQYVYADYNALSAVESSLYKASIKTLSLEGNRIKTLPADLVGKSFQIFKIEWNFLDVSPGSADRSILDSLSVSSTLAYANQLSRVHISSSSSAQDSITLKWSALSDGSVGPVSWKVLKFEVYDGTGSPASLLDTLDETAVSDTLGGLESGREYNLFVRVLYELNVSGMKNQTSCDTYTKVSTLAAGATAEPTAAEQPTQAETTPTAATTVLPSESATATPAASSSTGGNAGLLIGLIAVGAVVAIALVVLIALQLKRKPQTIRIRR